MSTSEDNISAGCSWGAKLKEEMNKLQEDQKEFKTEMQSLKATQNAVVQDAIRQTSADYEKRIARLQQEASTADQEREKCQQAVNIQNRNNNNLSQQNLQLKQQLQHHKETACLSQTNEDSAAQKLCRETDKRYDELLAEAKSSHHEEQRLLQAEREDNHKAKTEQTAQHHQELQRLKAQLQNAQEVAQAAQHTGYNQHQAQLDAKESRLQQQLHEHKQQQLKMTMLEEEVLII